MNCCCARKAAVRESAPVQAPVRRGIPAGAEMLEAAPCSHRHRHDAVSDQLGDSARKGKRVFLFVSAVAMQCCAVPSAALTLLCCRSCRRGYTAPPPFAARGIAFRQQA